VTKANEKTSGIPASIYSSTSYPFLVGDGRNENQYGWDDGMAGVWVFSDAHDDTEVGKCHGWIISQFPSLA